MAGNAASASKAALQLLTSSARASCRPSTSLLKHNDTRSLSSSASRGSMLADIRERLSKVALGSNYTKIRNRGGMLPEEKEQQDRDRERDTALASFSADGTPLYEDVDALPSAQQEQQRQQRISAKIEARQARKRFNATDPITGAALEHKYSTALFKISPRKLSMLAHQISGHPIDYAILQMQFSSKRASKRVLSTLALARDHAAAKGMQVPRLIVSEAWVTKGLYHRRMDIKGRGRFGLKHHPSARMHIVLRYGKTYAEKEAETLALARRRAKAIGTGGVARTNQPIVNQFQRPGWQW